MLIHDDCLAWLRARPTGSIHCCVTDAPYSLGFMGKTWDKHADYDAAFGYYLSGLVDGDGCFRVQAHQRGSANCAFQLKLRRDDVAILERARRELGDIGILRPMEGSGNASPLTAWIVQDKTGCLRVADYFSRFPLRAKKAHEFMVWRDAVTDWNEMARGNRWHGRGDYGPILSAKTRIERLRKYRDPAWSGNGFQDWIREWGEEVLRVLKPGGTILCFGGTRTVHRLTCGLEDAGFEIKDTLMWLHGQGFPKGPDIGKQLDKKVGATREVVGTAVYGDGHVQNSSKSIGFGGCDPNVDQRLLTTPATDAAKQWDGWKSHALKPAYEPIIMAMKPNDGSYADNALAHGVAGLNIDACRVGDSGGTCKGSKPTGAGHGIYGQGLHGACEITQLNKGRYPANIMHDGSPEVLAGFPNVKAGKAIRHRSGGKNCHSETKKPAMPDMGYGDDGSAARFFYCAKANKKERGEGNTHPTVKPLALMQWLVRLVCPPGGIVLDPFMGSGTTGVACREEGFDFIGIEQELESYEIAKRRCEI